MHATRCSHLNSILAADAALTGVDRLQRTIGNPLIAGVTTANLTVQDAPCQDNECLVDCGDHLDHQCGISSFV